MCVCACVCVSVYIYDYYLCNLFKQKNDDDELPQHPGQDEAISKDSSGSRCLLSDRQYIRKIAWIIYLCYLVYTHSFVHSISFSHWSPYLLPQGDMSTASHHPALCLSKKHLRVRCMVLKVCIIPPLNQNKQSWLSTNIDNFEAHKKEITDGEWGHWALGSRTSQGRWKSQPAVTQIF